VRRAAVVGLAFLIGAGLLLAAILLSGCPSESSAKTVELYALTSAPPARTALVTDTDVEHSLTITRGVALALACWDSCDGPCVDPTITVADPTLAAVRAVSRPTSATPAWVLVAAASGQTQLSVATTCATQTYSLRVVDPGP
jgi:hypothetical protein